MFDIREELKRLPDKPGVYMMFNEDDEIIYVGKAKNLKKRVRQYFTSTSNQTEKVIEMVKHIKRFEYIIVDNEVESLILESNFIKDKKPKYNILLKNGEKYPFIKINNEKFPRIIKDRVIKKDGAKYFGPFPNAYAVTEIIEILQDMFKVRRCNLNFDKGQYLKRPCLYYYIKKCSGPCIKNISEEEYLKNIEEVELFLKGKESKIIDETREKMLQASKELNYELAARYRDNLQNIETIIEKQKVRNAKGTNMDIIALARNGPDICVQVFLMRNGKIIDREHFSIEDEFYEKDSEIMSSFLKQFYLDMAFIPKEILVDILPEDLDTLEKYLSNEKGSKVKIVKPQRGEKVKLVEMVETNAKEMLEKHITSKQRRERNKDAAVKELKELIGIDDTRRIECYDISNISGVQSVGSMIVFENGEKTPKEYRKFKIKTVEGADDYASHREVLTRRFSRFIVENKKGNNLSGFGKRPSLIIMDGGKGQVNIAKDVLKEFNLAIPAIGLVKDDFHKTRGIIYENQEYPLKVSSALYRMLFQIQEEAHRFAINYHRKLREHDLKKSQLDEIEGIGNIRKKALIKHFKSIDKIKKASIEELMEVDKINRSTAENIYNFFKEEKN
ncbi:excinuclease ABC subunit UvrC [Miniphocaeibacter halophilus]|uniref:Excinuclease ABC subunit UvrC n=1 Tax=Miniphocaeibacter halophilus TaxID=2931922 RepID=A0AC61MXZ5_9FIRM|nr:excinuclease ABC subunit UvrC [Miniphocaeibacter halophilus]QQK07403.1 excinuclease ABC subunit UvrC [Miniphocaeibacter halophilus]